MPSRDFNAYWAEFEPIEAGQSRLHEHPGVELLYVISGRVELRIREDKHEWVEGDSVYFDSSVAHGYRRIGAKHPAALVAALGPRS